MNTTQKPKALRLAEHWEKFRSFPDDSAAASELRYQHALLIELAYQLSGSKDRIAELEAQLSAIGAGGVEPLRKQNIGDSEDNLTMASAIIMQREADARDAARYRWLRSRDLETISQGGVFAGMTPENVILNREDLDEAVDAAIAAQTRQGGAA